MKAYLLDRRSHIVIYTVYQHEIASVFKGKFENDQSRAVILNSSFTQAGFDNGDQGSEKAD